MYSGSDSTESQNYPQWALNPSAYQNMSNDQVDWAALAQQWIIMKEAGPPPVVPPELKPKTKKEIPNEGGEAPMDVENEKDDTVADSWSNTPNQNNDWSWNAQNQTWGWTNAWTPPTGVPPPAPMKPPLLPTPANYNQYGAPPDSGNDNANFGGYTTAPNNDYTSGYWTSAGSLEKMERDKQKQMEREKEKQEREEYNEKMKQNEKETMEILKSTIKEQQKSKFVSFVVVVVLQFVSLMSVQESDGEYSDDDVQERKKSETTPLTPAEQMMNVRRTMTEILLKVTNREIETICREELQRHHKKYKASDHRVSAPSGANVTAKLGLGIYGGGSGSSSSDNDSDEESQDRRDSDTELKDSIKRKKAEFSKTEREIEDKLAEAERSKQDTVSRSPTPDTNDNDTQVDAKAQ
ncbi:arginine/serine-rich protein PNISR, partial [Asbolus verrucosus]